MSVQIRPTLTLLPMDLSCPGCPLATVDNTHAVCVETGISTETVVLAIELLNGPPADLDAPKTRKSFRR